jgi:peptidoglycan/xylan/chitin deacetylase (PgdA/CDA1 family)
MTSPDTWLTHLCFHGIGTPTREREAGESHYWIDADTFRRVLDLVVDRDDVRLSFDDGNASDMEIGLTELRERGLTASFFPLAGRLGEPGSVSGGDLRALAAAEMRVGTHGMHHQPWRRLGAKQRRVEFDDARQLLAEAVGAPVTEAACPLGVYDRGVLLALFRRGYTAVHTSDRARARPGAWLQPRYSLRATDELEDVQAILEDRAGFARQVKDGARILAKAVR